MLYLLENLLFLLMRVQLTGIGLKIFKESACIEHRTSMFETKIPVVALLKVFFHMPIITRGLFACLLTLHTQKRARSVNFVLITC